MLVLDYNRTVVFMIYRPRRQAHCKLVYSGEMVRYLEYFSKIAQPYPSGSTIAGLMVDLTIQANLELCGAVCLFTTMTSATELSSPLEKRLLKDEERWLLAPIPVCPFVGAAADATADGSESSFGYQLGCGRSKRARTYTQYSSGVHSVRMVTADLGEIPALAKLLRRAFINDPMMNYIANLEEPFSNDAESLDDVTLKTSNTWY
ncbi:hypothetical protein HETIRDRAFT_452641 [Heterobasidion irregulare TC 32-1]|uniref:Uncharacterized protein n=1 Tax=Heterobasidion irregulare (strain TC 32-1) TaxID=747525 RepID=W4K151_HETIT|nr:uncharacterized protein HETIRDRAFT_452641 [Heterobasidion irregulare TC 32-1]ETW79449.1 hypothetical protein HETIRDRAFT_452641 [Heterobasidion irregulare TC 32-1]